MSGEGGHPDELHRSLLQESVVPLAGGVAGGTFGTFAALPAAGKVKTAHRLSPDSRPHQGSD